MPSKFRCIRCSWEYEPGSVFRCECGGLLEVVHEPIKWDRSVVDSRLCPMGVPYSSGVFFVHENHSFEEWMTRERQRLHLLAVDALSDLIDYEIQNQAYPAGLEHTERLVALDPLDEAARCRMMRLLAGSGRRGEALAQYESLRRSLAEELGVEPAAGTRALYEQIRAGELESLPAAQKQLLG